MIQANVPLLIVKLIAGGLAAFFAIMLMSKTRDLAWMCLAAGIVTSYAGIVYDTLLLLGVLVPSSNALFGISLIAIIFAILPSAFFATCALILILRS